jgi:hypothetical protein
MPLPIYYVGTPDEVGHHARPLIGKFDVRIEDAESIVQKARPGDVCVFYNEFFARYRLANHALFEKQCITLYAMDGILEWRNLWDFPPGISCLWTARPILSHKVACIGRSQARIFESWGLGDLCENVGIPRLDPLLGQLPRVRRADEPFTILVMTAKCPGFNRDQLRKTAQSLCDLKKWLERHPYVKGVPVRVRWRITQKLETHLGVENTLRDTTGKDLAKALAAADAVITTPSTAMLEGMLQQLPIAVLDYHNCPHYVPAAWRITAPSHFDQVVPELVTPPPAKMLYQQHLLHDALECNGPSLPRLCELITRMHELGAQCLASGQKLSFPKQILRRSTDEQPADSIPVDYARLFPHNPAFSEYEIRRLQAEVADLREAATTLAGDLRQLSNFMHAQDAA